MTYSCQITHGILKSKIEKGVITMNYEIVNLQKKTAALCESQSSLCGSQC